MAILCECGQWNKEIKTINKKDVRQDYCFVCNDLTPEERVEYWTQFGTVRATVGKMGTLGDIEIVKPVTYQDVMEEILETDNPPKKRDILFWYGFVFFVLLGLLILF